MIDSVEHEKVPLVTSTKELQHARGSTDLLAHHHVSMQTHTHTSCTSLGEYDTFLNAFEENKELNIKTWSQIVVEKNQVKVDGFPLSFWICYFDMIDHTLIGVQMIQGMMIPT